MTRRLRTLTSTWRRFTVRPALDPTGYSPLLSAAGGDYTKNVDVYYSRGEMTRIGRQTFLVAYHAEITRPEYAAVDTTPNTVEGRQRLSRSLRTIRPLTPNTLLHLSLLNPSTAGNLMDIRPFNLRQEMAEANKPMREIPGAFLAARQQAARFATVSSLKQLGLAIQMYAQDHDQRLPPLRTMQESRSVLMEYVKSAAVFAHPISHQPYQPNSAMDGKSLGELSDPATAVLFYEATPADDGTRAVLFANGAVMRLPDALWRRDMAK